MVSILRSEINKVSFQHKSEFYLKQNWNMCFKTQKRNKPKITIIANHHFYAEKSDAKMRISWPGQYIKLCLRKMYIVGGSKTTASFRIL